MPKSGCLPPIPPPITSKSAQLLPSVRYGRRFFYSICPVQPAGLRRSRGTPAGCRSAPPTGARTAGLRPAAAPPPVRLRRGSIGKCSPPLRKSLCGFLPICMKFSPFIFWRKSVLFSPECRLSCVVFPRARRTHNTRCVCGRAHLRDTQNLPCSPAAWRVEFFWI